MKRFFTALAVVVTAATFSMSAAAGDPQPVLSTKVGSETTNEAKFVIDNKQPNKDEPAKKAPPKVVKKEQVLPKDVPTYLQDVSVTIHSNRSQGSGTIKTRDGVNYVWTCGHVVRSLRSEREIIDPKTGGKKTVIEFEDAKIVKELVEDGRSVGQVVMFAEIIRYSDAENGEDLALLRVRKKNFVNCSVQFYLDEKIPALGTKLLHCGSLLGQQGSNSMTNGIVSQHGRVLNNTIYDQTTCAAFPGSSGGGVYLEDGRYMGMIVRGAGETFNLIVPQRRIAKWAKKVGVEFALDDNIAVPSDDELKKYPVEDAAPGGAFQHDAAKAPGGEGGKSLDFKFLILETDRPKAKAQTLPLREVFETDNKR